MSLRNTIEDNNIVLWSILFTLPFYLVGNEIAKGLLVLTGLAALLLITTKPVQFFKALTRTEILFCGALVLFPLGFGLAYQIHDTKRDYELFIEFMRMSLLVIALFLYLNQHNRSGFSDAKLSIAVFGILSGAVGVYHWLIEGGRIAVGTDLINMYGALMAIAGGLSFYFLFSERDPWKMVLYFVSAILSLAGVMVSGSKIAILAIVLILICCLIITGKKRIKLLLAVLLPTVFLVLAVAPVKRFVLMADVLSATTESSAKPSQIDGSIGIRLQMYSAASKAIKSNPVIGYGTQRFKDQFPRELESGQLLQSSRRFAHVHNELLQAWMSRGVIGLFSFILLIAAPVIAAQKRPREVRVSVVITATVLFLIAMFEAPLNANVSYGFFILLLGLMLSFKEEKITIVKASQ